jgi:hypothetical protein
MSDLPRPVADLCAVLGDQRGVLAVALGGSRAAGTADAASDWDLGLYYRGEIDLTVLRDLDVVRHWSAEAERWRYEVDARLGSVAGTPTYSLMAELAVSRALVGTRPEISAYPAALAETGARRWRGHAKFSLEHAHACRERLWVLNEKMLAERTGLAALHGRFTRIPAGPASPVEWVGGLRRALDAA